MKLGRQRGVALREPIDRVDCGHGQATVLLLQLGLGAGRQGEGDDVGGERTRLTPGPPALEAGDSTDGVGAVGALVASGSDGAERGVDR